MHIRRHVQTDAEWSSDHQALLRQNRDALKAQLEQVRGRIAQSPHLVQAAEALVLAIAAIETADTSIFLEQYVQAYP